jgi:integrase
MPKITKRFVESIVPDTEKTLKFWDSELKGFGLLVLPSGRRTYCVKYRNANRIQKHVKIGIHGQINTEEARSLAKQHLGEITYGEDPAAKKKDNKALPLMKELVQDYLDRHATRKRAKSIKEDKRFLERFVLPQFGNQHVKNISRRAIESLHLQLGKTPTQANRVVALLSKMFNLAISWGWREDNPTKGIAKYQEEKRDRWLSQEELDRLWDVLDQHPTHITAYFIKFLLLTGARSGETLSATWSQFDLEKGIWTKPSHLTKQNKKEHLPLSEKALEVLQTLKTLNPHSVYLFLGRVEGQHMKEPKRFWGRVLKDAGIKDFRIHDLRHTHASHLVSSGLSLSIVGKLLGHTQASTTQRYAHLADTPLREAADLFGSKVGGKKRVV